MTIFLILDLSAVLCLLLVLLFCRRAEKREYKPVDIRALKQLFADKTIKLKYLPLPSSKVHDRLLYLLSISHPIMYFEQPAIKHKDYLLALSKFIDYKLSTGHNTFRAKNHMILIEEIATYLADSLISSNCCNLFAQFKMLSKTFKLKQKEFKVFKLILSQKLLLRLSSIESELIDISFTIKNAKTTKRIRKFRKKLLFDSQIYSIANFNANASKLLYGQNLNLDKIVSNLFLELFYAERKLKVITGYLIAMFN